MRLLDRYLLRELLIPLGYCLGGFMIFYTAFDLIFSLSRFMERKLLFSDVVEYYLVTSPETLVLIIPVALLLALLYSLTHLGRHHELTAMRAAGIGLWRLSVPAIGVGLCLGFVIFVINELWVPQSSEKSEEILNRRLPQTGSRIWRSNLNFLNESEHRRWDIRNFNLVTGEMIHPTVIWDLPDKTGLNIYADSGIYTNGAWTFYGVEQWRSFPPPSFPVQSTNAVAEFHFEESPAWIRSEIKVVSQTPAQAAKKPRLSILEIYNYTRLHPRLNPELRASLMTQLQGRFAEPFTCLAVVLIALPFGAPSGRRNVFAGVAGGIFICFAYFIMQRISFGMGIGGYLPPVVAAWLPNLVFGAAGLALMTRTR